MSAGDGAEETDLAPEPERDGVDDGDGEAAVDLRELRQIGDVAGGTVDAAFARNDEARNRFQQRRLARAVRAHDGGEAAGGEVAAQMMDGGHAVIGDGQVGDGKGRDVHRASAQNTQSQSTAAAPSASPSLGPRPAAKAEARGALSLSLWRRGKVRFRLYYNIAGS